MPETTDGPLWLELCVRRYFKKLRSFCEYSQLFRQETCIQAYGSNLSSGTTPKVMTGEHKSGTDALAKSPVYSPLGSSAHEVRGLLHM